jgi:DNA topoisomerase-3
MFHFCERINGTVTFEQAEKLDQSLSYHLQEPAQQPPIHQTVLQCPSCGMDMVLRIRREDSVKFIGCMGYPDCRNVVWFSGNVEDVELSGEFCSEVGDLEEISIT